MKKELGFTLIELMMVVAIVAILVAIALPVYQSYIRNTGSKACLSEVKNYSNYIFYALNDQNDDTVPTSPNISACQFITDASSWDETTTNLVVEAKSKNSAIINIKCDLSKGANCTIIP